MVSAGLTALMLDLNSRCVPGSLVCILYLHVTSGAAKYDFYVGTMRIAARESDTVGLRDFHCSAQRSH